MSENKELIESVLKKGPQDIAFEPIPDENTSPLAQPVISKNDTSNQAKESKIQKDSPISKNHIRGEEDKATAQSTATAEPERKTEPIDAPEQEVNAESQVENGSSSSSGKDEPEFTIPIAQAGMLADTILGVVNNTVLEVGAGYFVTISKHKDFYDFDEVIQVIEQQNVKNIKRIKLDEEDKAMLRPLLIHVLRKKAKVMTPEQQLLGVCLSIIIKKAKIVMEIRAENEVMVERIRDIIRKEIRAAQNEMELKQEDDPDVEKAKEEYRPENSTEQDFEHITYEESYSNPNPNKTGLPDSVLETT